MSVPMTILVGPRIIGLPDIVMVELLGPKVKVDPPRTIFVTEEVVPLVEDTGNRVNVIPPLVIAV